MTDMWISQAVQIAVLAAFVYLTIRLLARNRPHLAYLLWLVVLIKCVTPPVWSSPTSPFSWLQSTLAENRQRSGPARDPRIAGLPPAPAIAGLPQVLSGPGELHEDWNATTVETEPVAGETNTPHRRTQQPALGWSLSAVWVLGTFAAAIIATARRVRCMRSLRRAASIPSPQLERLTAQLAKRLRVRRQVRLLVTTSNVGPAVIGLLRPLIVLPEVIVTGKPARQIEAIIAHELIHVRRGDLWLGVLQVCSKTAWWFYPPVYWACRLSTREAERCCDEEVVGELGCDPKQYAKCLLDVLERKRTLQSVPAFPGMKPIEVTSQRLERVMKLGHGCHKRAPRWCWAIMLLFAAAALPGAALVVGDEPTAAPNLYPLEPIASENAAPGTQQYLVRETGETFTFYGTSADSAEASAPRTGVTTVEYSSNKLVAELQSELRCNKEQATTMLATLLKQEAGTSDQLPVPGKRPGKDGVVSITAPAAGHRRVRAALKRMETFGVQQIVLQVQFVVAPRDLVDSEIDDWELTPVDLADESLSLSSFSSLNDRPLPAAAATPAARAGVTTTTGLPATQKVVSAAAAKQLLDRLQKNSQTRIEARIQVRLINGQSGSVVDVSQRPFVVGVKKIAGELKTVAQPQVKVVDCGRVLRVRPLLREGNHIWLDYDVQQNDIVDVEQRTVRAAGFDHPIVLQVPHTHIARIESAVELELNETVILGGLPATPSRDNEQALLVMMTVQRGRQEDTPQSLSAIPAAETHDPPRDDRERYDRVPILGPLTSGTVALDPPSDNQILRAFKRADVQRWQALTAVGRNSVQVTKQQIADYTDPPRFVPLIGEASLHHMHYKCTLRGSDGTSDTLYVDYNYFQLPEAVAEPWQQLKLPRPVPPQPLRPLAYNVADLVVPIPGTGRAAKVNASGAAVDFKSLVQLITSTIEPESWEEAGGLGTVNIFPTNLSLIITQSEENHAQITDLLAQLRRLREVQICVEAKWIRLPEPVLKKFGIAAAGNPASQARPLKAEEAQALLQAADASVAGAMLSAPKVTVFNGQEFTLAFETGQSSESPEFRCKAVCSTDRRSVHLSCGWGADDDGREPVVNTVADGATLFVSAANAFNSSAEAESGEFFLLVTPRILVAEEEEQRFP